MPDKFEPNKLKIAVSIIRSKKCEPIMREKEKGEGPDEKKLEMKMKMMKADLKGKSLTDVPNL